MCYLLTGELCFNDVGVERAASTKDETTRGNSCTEAKGITHCIIVK